MSNPIYRERMKVVPVCWEIENRGITFNRSRLESMKEEFQYESRSKRDRCEEIARSTGYDLQMPVGITDSLKEFVFEHMKAPIKKWTEGNAPAFDAEAINKIIENIDNPFLLEFLKTMQVMRSYNSALKAMDSYERFGIPINGSEFCRLHPNINPTGTNTLRFSSANPNGQNIAKEKEVSPEFTLPSLRQAFGPAPGREWYSLDYENMELCIPGYYSGEQKMIDLFERPDEPPYFGSYHLLNASLIYPDLFRPLADQKGAFKEKYKATWYQWCKNFGFAFQYGAGLQTADRAAHKKGAYELVVSNLKEHSKLNAKMIAMAERLGYVETIPDRSIHAERGYPILCTRTEWGKVLPTVPLNFFVQSTAMWCTMKAMIRCQAQLDEWRRKEKFTGFITLQVHDELVFDFPARRDSWGNLGKAKEIQSIMQKSGDDIGIPLKVSLSYHPRNWAEEIKP